MREKAITSSRFKHKHDRALHFFAGKGGIFSKTRALKACRKKDAPEEMPTPEQLLADYDTAVIERMYREMAIEPRGKTRSERSGEGMRFGLEA